MRRVVGCHTAPLLAAILLAGCGALKAPGGTGPGAEPVATPGATPGARQGDGVPAARPAPAPRAVPAAPRVAPEAVPRGERIPQGAPNVPYEIRGEIYEPAKSDEPLVETGIASWYGQPFHGRRTAIGEVYDMHTLTAAHKTMPLPSYAVVRNLSNGREVLVRVNDRGPFIAGRVIDLSLAAAKRLRISGIARVEVRRLTHAEIRTGAWKLPPAAVAGDGPGPANRPSVIASR